MRLILTLCSLSLYLYYSEACTCLPIPPNGCGSDYSILGYVVGVRRIGQAPGDRNIYTVVVQRVFKRSKYLKYVIRIESNVSSAACGVNLQVGKTYVISGSVNKYRFTTNVCQYVREWRRIPLSQRKGLFCRKRVHSGVTGQHGMLTPPWHLILPLMLWRSVFALLLFCIV